MNDAASLLRLYRAPHPQAARHLRTLWSCSSRPYRRQGYEHIRDQQVQRLRERAVLLVSRVARHTRQHFQLLRGLTPLDLLLSSRNQTASDTPSPPLPAQMLLRRSSTTSASRPPCVPPPPRIRHTRHKIVCW